MNTNNEVTIAGLVTWAVLVPAEWLTYGEKLLYGAVLALITGFTYKAGGWVWDRLLKKKGPDA